MPSHMILILGDNNSTKDSSYLELRIEMNLFEKLPIAQFQG